MALWADAVIFFINKETAVRIIQARAGPRRKALPLKSYFLDLISDFRVYTKLETLSIFPDLVNVCFGCLAISPCKDDPHR